MDAQQTHSFYPTLPPPVRVRLVTLEEHPCPYLPEKMARNRALWVESIPALLYHEFMDAGFRRSGKLMYQPVCAGCRACVQIRVPVPRFIPSKSQRRVWRKNADLSVTVAPPSPTDERYALYLRYQREWHASDITSHSREDFEAFLYASPVDSLEFSYRTRDGKLIGVGICDACPASLSSVYFYFDPAEAWRGLGTFAAMYELDWARQQKIPYYYLGYWIRGCGAMEYKARFRPFQLLGTDGVWREAPDLPEDLIPADTAHPQSP